MPCRHGDWRIAIDQDGARIHGLSRAGSVDVRMFLLESRELCGSQPRMCGTGFHGHAQSVCEAPNLVGGA